MVQGASPLSLALVVVDLEPKKKRNER